MTTASSAGDKPWPRWRLMIAALGHHEPKLSIPFSAANLTYWLPFFWLPVHNTVHSAAIWVWCTILGVEYMLLYAAGQHRKLWICDRCLNDHSLIDQQAQVDKHRETLRRCHSPRTQKMATLFLYTYLVAIMLGLWIVEAHGLLKLGLQVLATLLLVGGLGHALYHANERRIHTWLRPWCPWCHPRRDKDDEQVTPEPTPDPAGGITV